MVLTGNIDPRWDISHFKMLEYKFDTHKDTELLTEYENLGHSCLNMTLYNYFEPNPMPVCIRSYVLPNFDYMSNISVAVNLFKPGQYLPTHVDLFGRYRTVHSLDDSKKIVRAVVMLEDSAPGQISQACDVTLGKWTAGQWIQWDETDPHAFYNFSMKDRYALQITGTIS